MQLINKKTLLGMIPLSEKAIYNMEKRGDFPKRIALTHSIISETLNPSIGAGLLAVCSADTMKNTRLTFATSWGTRTAAKPLPITARQGV